MHKKRYVGSYVAYTQNDYCYNYYGQNIFLYHLQTSNVVHHFRHIQYLVNIHQAQWYTQDLNELGHSHAKCMCKIFSHAPKMLTTPLDNVFLKIAGLTKAILGHNYSDEKLLFREQILEATKFIAGSSYQLSIISNSYH